MPPSLEAHGLVSFSVQAAGQELVSLTSDYRVISIAIDKGLNTIGTATLVLIDGDPATGEFPVCDSDTFKPGTSIDIAVGYDNNLDLLFRGLVVGLAVASQGAQGIQLTVSCKDEAVKMTGSRVIMPFPNQTTSDTLAQIVGNYGGLSANIAPTTGVQDNRSDWDFIVTQAEANGQVVFSDNGQLMTMDLATPDDDALALEYGRNVYSFSLNLDARTQFGTVKAQSWSAALQDDITVTAEQPNFFTLGNLDASELANALGQEAYYIRTAADVDVTTLQVIANAYLAKRLLAKVKGSIEMPGSSLAQPGSTVRLTRIGARFSGRALVSQVTHTIGGGDWRTQLTLGTDEQPFAERNPNVVPPVGANNIASGVQGLYTAVVKALQPSATVVAEVAVQTAQDKGAAPKEEASEEAVEASKDSITGTNEKQDNKGDFQVQVLVASLNNALLWARLAQPSASKGAGTYFYPEVGDEVILGFLGDDIRAPVILGSLYSKERGPAYVTDAANNIKAIVTRNKLTLEFDEAKGSITLKTPGNNHLIISDTAEGLVLTDQQFNTITLSSGGIDLVSKSDIRITAANNINLDAQSGMVTINGSTSVALAGLSISADATSELSLSSNVKSSLTSTVMTVVKGAMVLIN